MAVARDLFCSASMASSLLARCGRCLPWDFPPAASSCPFPGHCRPDCDPLHESETRLVRPLSGSVPHPLGARARQGRPGPSSLVKTGPIVNVTVTSKRSRTRIPQSTRLRAVGDLRPACRAPRWRSSAKGSEKPEQVAALQRREPRVAPGEGDVAQPGSVPTSRSIGGIGLRRDPARLRRSPRPQTRRRRPRLGSRPSSEKNAAHPRDRRPSVSGSAGGHRTRWSRRCCPRPSGAGSAFRSCGVGEGGQGEAQIVEHTPLARRHLEHHGVGGREILRIEVAELEPVAEVEPAADESPLPSTAIAEDPADRRAEACRFGSPSSSHASPTASATSTPESLVSSASPRGCRAAAAAKSSVLADAPRSRASPKCDASDQHQRGQQRRQHLLAHHRAHVDRDRQVEDERAGHHSPPQDLPGAARRTSAKARRAIAMPRSARQQAERSAAGAALHRRAREASDGSGEVVEERGVGGRPGGVGRRQRPRSHQPLDVVRRSRLRRIPSRSGSAVRC